MTADTLEAQNSLPNVSNELVLAINHSSQLFQIRNLLFNLTVH
jgi:hypothetical protein